MRRKPSFLFAPYKVMGMVCTDVKPVLCTAFSKNKMTSLYCAIDNSVHHYNATKLRTVAISKSLPNVVTALAVEPTGVFAAAGKEIFFMKFCRTVEKTFTVNHVTKHLMIFGEQLIVIDEENGIKILNKEDGSEILYLEGSPEFNITALVHPATYLNKIVIGSSSGKLKIVNVKTGKIVHEFKSLVDSAVTVVEQSPVVDVLAVGFANGRVLLYDIRSAEVICSFKHDSRITAIGFRTDGEPFLTTGDFDGNIAVWDLEKRELIGKVGNVHKKSITRLYFLPAEPIMISTSSDNSIRTWVLDGMDGMPRQLNILEGHSDPITAVNFSNKEEIVSASLDGSVRKLNIANPTMRQKLGNAGIMSRAQAKAKKRSVDSILLEPVVEIAFGWSREAAWDNILCRHKNTLLVTTWTSRKNSLGTHKIAHKRFSEIPALYDAIATSVAISPCGNFGYIGYSSGHVDQVNIQSGRFVRTFIDPSYQKIAEDEVTLKAHTSAVACISVDCRGNEIVTGCKSGELKFWELSTGKLLTVLKSKLSIKSSTKCPTSSLIAVACQKEHSRNASVSIIDTICRKIVRTFNLPGALPTAVTFSSDGRWLLTADDSGLIRVWELATSQLIDVILSEKKCVGLSFNPTGEFLASVHENDNAIYIWANQVLFSSFISVKALPLDYKPKWQDSSACPTLDLYSSDEDEEESAVQVSADFDRGLVSYSGLSTARWANLSDLSVIKDRNKPIEAPKKPKQAPFFLTAAATLEGFEFEAPVENDDDSRKTLQAKRSLLEIESSFSASLRKAVDDSNYLELFAKLKDMSMSTIDFQIRSLPASVLPQFFRMISIVMKTNQDFELAQSYMSAAIKIHRSSLWSPEDEELTKALSELAIEQEKDWTPFEDILTNNASVVQWVKNALL